jgi:hypothetical protein
LAAGGPLAARKVFTRADVIVAVAPVLYGQDPALLGPVVSRVLRHPEAIPLVGVAAAREQAYAPACVVAAEAAIAETMETGSTRITAPAVGFGVVEQAIWAKGATLAGLPLTVGQTDGAIALATSGRGAELVLGVAGAGKTTMIDVVRAAFEAGGYRVVGTSTSGQATRTLGDEAHLETRTVASLLWRLDHDRLRLDAGTVLIVDEAAMTDDPALLRLLVAAETAGAKTILVGDHRQLGAVGPAGAFEGLVRRQPDAVHVLRGNVRQHDLEERHTLAHLRAGDVSTAVEWYVNHDRIHVAPTRAAALTDLVDNWYQDVEAGRDAAMFAWRRANVAELNRLARHRWAAEGHLGGPELGVPGGRTYAAGDRIVLLAPAADGRLVTSQAGTVAAVDPSAATLVLRMDDQEVRLSAVEAGADRLDYGYARTVHRSQGDTVDVSHRYLDGGGRELAYVSMSRARHEAFAYVVADDIDQAKGDMAQDWSHDRRQRWAIDTGTPATSVADIEHEPGAPAGCRPSSAKPGSDLNAMPSPTRSRRTSQPSGVTAVDSLRSSRRAVMTSRPADRATGRQPQAEPAPPFSASSTASTPSASTPRICNCPDPDGGPLATGSVTSDRNWTTLGSTGKSSPVLNTRVSPPRSTVSTRRSTR